MLKSLRILVGSGNILAAIYLVSAMYESHKVNILMWLVMVALVIISLLVGIGLLTWQEERELRNARHARNSS